ncbi:MAG: hypothetical protein GX766_05170 [Firmicutes bacterium]|jgi:hypothetical protein|nr:hypothetical protein [Bacillota bacterium]HQD38993.1 hypothetical protein [Bacillota bacterium]
MKRAAFLLLIILFSFGLASAATIADLSGSLLEQLEEEVYGLKRSGALVERLADLEVDLTGAEKQGATLTRLFELRDLVFGPGAEALTFQLNALEWHVLKEQSSLPMSRRLTAIEAAFLGQTQIGEGSLKQRVEKLLRAAFGTEKLSTNKAVLRQWTPVDVELLTTIDSGKVSPGQLVRYRVIRDVVYAGQLLIPAGTYGQGRIVSVSMAGYFGKSGSVEIDFGTIKALDGTAVPVVPRTKLQEKDEQPLRLAVGLSMGGLLLTGKLYGALFGIPVRGNQLLIPQGTELALEVSEPVEVIGLVLNN